MNSLWSVCPPEVDLPPPEDLLPLVAELGKRAPMRFGKRVIGFSKKAPMRFGKRAPMRFGKRAPMRFGKRAPMRFGKRDYEDELGELMFEDSYLEKRAPMRFGKRSDDYDY